MRFARRTTRQVDRRLGSRVDILHTATTRCEPPAVNGIREVIKLKKFAIKIKHQEKRLDSVDSLSAHEDKAIDIHIEIA
jgi:hypothetical protein